LYGQPLPSEKSEGYKDAPRGDRTRGAVSIHLDDVNVQHPGAVR
jgi:hypothetical protein